MEHGDGNMSITIQEFVTKQNILNNKRRLIDGPDISWEDTGAGFRPHILNFPTQQSSGDTYDGYFKVTNTSTTGNNSVNITDGACIINGSYFPVEEANLTSLLMPESEITYIYIQTTDLGAPEIKVTSTEDDYYPQGYDNISKKLIAVAEWTPADPENPESVDLISSIIQINYGPIYFDLYWGDFAVTEGEDDTYVYVKAGTIYAGITEISVPQTNVPISLSGYIYITLTYSAGAYTASLAAGAIPSQSLTEYIIPIAQVTISEGAIINIAQMQHGSHFVAGRLT